MKRIMIDASKCDGCKNCSVACMNAHREGGGDVRTLDLTDRANESRNYIYMTEREQYIPIFCRHCDEPKCAEGCMSGALQKDVQSVLVTYDKTKCGQCFMCVMNCPYGLPKPDTLTNSYVVKCDFCAGDGHEPNCVKSCPKKAIWVEEVQTCGI